MDFGKNRIQYKPIEWSFYRFERMDVYFYSGGKELAKRTAQTAESTLAEYEQLFDYTLENRIQLLVFNRLSDLKQSNVGLGGQSIDNIGGTTRMVGSKVLLYFENGTASFVEQIRSGIAEAVVNELNSDDSACSAATRTRELEWELQPNTAAKMSWKLAGIFFISEAR